MLQHTGKIRIKDRDWKWTRWPAEGHVALQSGTTKIRLSLTEPEMRLPAAAFEEQVLDPMFEEMFEKMTSKPQLG
jgi:hypothetical protein